MSIATSCKPAICIRELAFGYEPNRPVVRIGHLDIAERSVVTILGPSGCGKTTLLMLIAGLLRSQAGRILVLDRDPVAVRKEGLMGFVFQSPSLVPWRTVAANVALPFELQGKEVAADVLQDHLALVNLDGVADAYPDQLSGGMRGRVALARALATKPDLLLLDEPFANLDEFRRLHLNLAVSEIQRRVGMTVIVVTHNVVDAILISNRIICLGTSPTGDKAAAIQQDLTIEFDNGRSLDILNTPRFRELHQSIVASFRNDF